MTRNEIDILWQQAMTQAVKDGEMFTRYEFAKLVAAAERRKHQGDIERWKEAAVTAQKWRAMALSKDDDGRTVQRIQQEAAAAEREACAMVCSGRAMQCESEAQRAIENGEHDEVSAIRSTAWQISVCAAVIRARGNA